MVDLQSLKLEQARKIEEFRIERRAAIEQLDNKMFVLEQKAQAIDFATSVIANSPNPKSELLAISENWFTSEVASIVIQSHTLRDIAMTM